MKQILLHRHVQKELRKLSPRLRRKIAEYLQLLAEGENLSLPISRPMPDVAHGAHELRLKDSAGQLRVFYFVKLKGKIVVFHLFRKKTQKTPKKELELAFKRLGELI